MPRRTKIVATLGPATNDKEVIEALIDAGADVVRINLSHGEAHEHLHRARLVRAYPSKDPVTLLAELDAAVTDLIEYLRRLDPDDWAKDFGVRHGNERLTVSGSVGEVIDDFAHHTRQLEQPPGGGESPAIVIVVGPEPEQRDRQGQARKGKLRVGHLKKVPREASHSPLGKFIKPLVENRAIC